MNCPACRQPFTAQIEQVLDVGLEPTGKQRLLSGRLNLIQCPACGSQGRVETPLLYHDPGHELLLVFVPVGLNLTTLQREQLIGSLTRTLMAQIPPEGRRGYLFSPQTCLTLESLMDRVLQADGLPAGLLERQRQQQRLLEQMLAADETEVRALAQAHDEEVGGAFFQMLSALISMENLAGDGVSAGRLIRLRNQLVSLATWSRERGLTARMLDEQQTRLDLLQRFLATEESEWTGMVVEHNGRFDYGFFQLLTATAEGTSDELADKLLRLRALLVDRTDAGRDISAGQRAVEELGKTASEAGGITRQMLLDRIVAAENDVVVDVLARAGAGMLDYSFFLVLADRIDQEKQGGNAQESARLTSLRDRLVDMTERWEHERSARLAEINRLIDDWVIGKDVYETSERLSEQFDQLVLFVLTARLEQAREAKREQEVEALQQLLERLLAEVREASPPEIRLINDLLAIEGEEELTAALRERQEELTPAVLDTIERFQSDLATGDQAELAERISRLLDYARRVVAG
jgi:hypothetical protein